MNASAQPLPHAADRVEPTPEQVRGMRNLIYGQTFGALGQLAYANGLLFLYFTQQKFSSAEIMLFLALPSVIQALTIVPLGYHADRKGLKRLIVPGSLIASIGFGAFALSGFVSNMWVEVVIAIGTFLYAFGGSMFGAVWFALLDPIVPKSIRGSFFGRMRLAYQLTGFLFGVACTFILTKDSPTVTFQAIFAFVAVCMLSRFIYMAQVPELEKPTPSGDSLISALTDIIRAPGYASFCCYTFLITLSTASAPYIFALIEKDALNFGDQAIIWMGNLLMIGAVAGFFIGGRAVDRLGTKYVFLMVHFAYALVMLGFLARIVVPLPLEIWLGFLNFTFGMISAASSIAISTEMMALIPRTNKSLSTGVCQTLMLAGSGLSGLLCAGTMNLNMFAERWSIAGKPLCAYDTMLMLSAVLVVVLVVALGLVPSVIGKAEYAPKGE